jgi:hypothetical protein
VHTLLSLAGDEHRMIELSSVSASNEQLATIISEVDSGLSLRSRLEVGARVPQGIDKYLAHPHSVFNTNNYAIPTTQQVLEGKTVGSFPTPKPKGFATIVPYTHRWITELWIEGHAYPKHSRLGTWIVRHPLLDTGDVRVGARGIYYCCPSSAYFGGDVDTILIRPQLYIPGALEIFQELAAGPEWTAEHSDKGFYSMDTVGKLGGLQQASILLRDSTARSVLKSYLQDGATNAPGSVFLASDRRRYYSLEGISRQFDDPLRVVPFIDDLIVRKVLHRGLVLKCQFCRAADWFPLGEISSEFRCRRCRREQTILSKNTLQSADPAWYYQLDEIVFQGLKNDMDVPLLALDYLRRSANSFLFTDELELRRRNDTRPFIEIDICCICDGVLVVGEAKATSRIEGGGKRERRSLAKYKDAALGLGARRFVLASSVRWNQETIANTHQAFSGTNIKVLVLDGPDRF